MSNIKSSRRRFIKTAAAGAAGLVVSSRALSSPPTPNVVVMFEGLMVFHKNGNEYEVGVLAPQIAPLHTFGIKKNDIPISASTLSQALTKGNSWRLDVKDTLTGNVRRNIAIEPNGHNSRLQEDPNRAEDFSWIANFESGEFHGDKLEDDADRHPELPMTIGLLKPIIHLSNGRLYTKYKIEKLKRQKGNGAFLDFGFVTETVGLDITLGLREALVLSVENQTQDYEIFKIPYTSGSTTKVLIENVIPKESRRGSHFRHYYGLFPTINDDEKYEIALKRPQELPNNPHPITREITTTIGDYPCGGIFLGIRTQSLK